METTKMELKNCKKSGLSIYDKPVLICQSGRDKYLVLPPIQRAHGGKFVGVRDRFLEEAKRLNASLYIRVIEPQIEFSISPVDFKKHSLKQRKRSKFGGFYEIFMYNITEELRKKTQAQLL